MDIIQKFEKRLITGFSKKEFFDYSNINMFLEEIYEEVSGESDLDEKEKFIENFLKTRKRFLLDNFIKPHLINVCVKDESNFKLLNDFILYNLEF